MATETSEKEAAQEAGYPYGAMAADLCLVHLSAATTEESMQEHVATSVSRLRNGQQKV